VLVVRAECCKEAAIAASERVKAAVASGALQGGVMKTGHKKGCTAGGCDEDRPQEGVHCCACHSRAV